MKIGICDDNTEERERLRELCWAAGCTDTCVFPTGSAFLQIAEKPDLLFLDIEMDGINGIELKEFLEQSNYQTYVVFYTAHSEWMSDAFGRNVIGFLRKPVKLREVQRCIKKSNFLHKEYHIVSVDTKTKLHCGEIVYIRANGVYSTFYCENGQIYSVRKPLYKWANELENLGFCTVHRSYVVNLKFVRTIDKKQVTLEDGRDIPLSRNLLKYAKEAYQEYCYSQLL